MTMKTELNRELKKLQTSSEDFAASDFDFLVSNFDLLGTESRIRLIEEDSFRDYCSDFTDPDHELDSLVDNWKESTFRNTLNYLGFYVIVGYLIALFLYLVDMGMS